MPAPDPTSASTRVPGGPSKSSRRGLDWFSFFLADVQTGFGPFMVVYLTSEKWANADIGLLLTVGSLLGLAGQIPAGALIDATPQKKQIVAFAVAGIGLSALAIAISPRFLFTLLAQIVHIGASVLVGPALIAISLGLVGHAHLGARLGRNAQFASAGSIFAVFVMGVGGYYLSSRAVFLIAAAMTIPGLLALALISSRDLHHEPRLRRRNEPDSVVLALRELLGSRDIIVLVVSVFLFHCANAGLMPLAANIITMRSEQSATLLVALCMIIPQLIVTAGSAWVGLQADIHGRKPLLLAAFAVLAVRSFAFGFCRDPYAFVMIQVLDGIAAAIIGILVAVCVADLTSQTAHFNLALGVVGVAMGLGAAASTTLTGDIADRAGAPAAFFTMSAIALAGLATVWRFFLETKPSTPLE
jgi:MFS family permease